AGFVHDRLERHDARPQLLPGAVAPQQVGAQPGQLHEPGVRRPARPGQCHAGPRATHRARPAGGSARGQGRAVDPDHVYALRLPHEPTGEGARGPSPEPRVRPLPGRRAEPVEEVVAMAIWDDVIPREERELYERGGWGGRVGFGRRPALLVIDMYTAFVDPAYPFASPGARECARAIRPILDAPRARGVAVLHTRGT